MSDTGLEIIGKNLDLIPTKIPDRLLRQTGNSESTLLEFCQEHQITLNGFEIIVEYIIGYKTNITTMKKLLEQGFSVQEVGNILETRERIQDQCGEKLSLSVITRACKSFFMESDPDCLTLELIELNKQISDHSRACGNTEYYTGQNLTNLINRTEEMGSVYLEPVSDFINEESPFGADDFGDESHP